MSNLKTLIKAFKSETKIFQDKLSTAFKDEVQKLLDANPEIHGIKWEQFTPYFNDGEPCEFQVHEYAIMFSKEDEDTKTYELSDREYDFAPDSKEAIITKKVHEVLNEFNRLPSEILRLLFGDHVEVIATRKGFRVEEYEDHD